MSSHKNDYLNSAHCGQDKVEKAAPIQPPPSALVPPAPDLDYLRSMSENANLPVFFRGQIAAAVHALQALAQPESEALKQARHNTKQARHNTCHARTEQERVAALTFWLDQQRCQSGMHSIAAATLRALHKDAREGGELAAMNACHCRACQPPALLPARMIVCSVCGNKRCPHANDHRHACTGSNEPPGSTYEGLAPAERISGQMRFLAWNRAQKEPLVKPGFEYAVFDAALLSYLLQG
jgi:hypothetical protein